MVAGASKLVQIAGFRDTLERTGFMSETEASALAIVLPLLEVVLALLLVTRTAMQIVAPIVLFLSACFSAVHGYAAIYGSVDCGCFGIVVNSEVGHLVLLGLSLAMLVGSVFIMRIPSMCSLPTQQPRAQSSGRAAVTASEIQD